jgi:hypothetical protein
MNPQIDGTRVAEPNALLRRLGRGLVAELALVVLVRSGRHVNFVLGIDGPLEILDRLAEAIAELWQLRRPEDDNDNDEDEDEFAEAHSEGHVCSLKSWDSYTTQGKTTLA